MSVTGIELESRTALIEPAVPNAAHLKNVVQDAPPQASGLSRHASYVSTAPVTSKGRTVIVVTSITMVTGVATMLNGLVTVILPTLAKDLALKESVLLWPTSIQALTCGCTLLLSGSIADAVGAKLMYQTGSLLQVAFVLGCGLSRNGFQMILFRGLGGIAVSFCLPSAVSIITASFEGRRRNMAFAIMGGGQPIGFILGLVLGGVLTEYVSWRIGFYIAAAITAANFFLLFFGLPSDDIAVRPSWRQKRHQIARDIDWVGALIISASLGGLSYVLSSIAGSVSDIKQPSNIGLLSASLLLLPVFVAWVGRQEKRGRPAIIPNSLWKNKIFTTICICVFMAWGAFNALETILTFYFQNVQKLTPLETSLRFLPAAGAGLAVNSLMGFMVHRVAANKLVITALIVACIAPLTMAFAHPTSSYWSSGFIGNVFNPPGVDALFTVSNLVITAVFPGKTQALAGGVFNTVNQIGKSVGLTMVAVIASSVTLDSGFADKSSPEALMVGYRATFWFCFALNVATVWLAIWGLGRIGKVGHKKD